ncbi:MAG TPA: DNA repair exonuclease, partial [Lysinibacillus sp.]|nr:DNA repair exonuclease [Lysinibacillus sp.]
WKDILKDLYQYAGGARLIEPLSDKDIENLTQNAQALLAEEIQRA